MAQLAQTDKAQKRWLYQLAKECMLELRQSPASTLMQMVPVNQLTLEDGTTNGWVTRLAKIRGDRGGELQLWLDDYPAAGSRRLCYCYKASKKERIQEIADAGTGQFGKAFPVTNYKRVWNYGKSYQQMGRPLPKRQYDQPVAELYDRAWCFYSVYSPEEIRSGQKPSRALILKITEFLVDVTHTLSALHNESDDAEQLVPKATMRQHMVRERQTKLAFQAKARDGFTCLICRINFEDLYGDLGRGYVEAHHIVPFSIRKTGEKIALEDLVTLCANCHRMVHRSIEREGYDGPDAIKAVRRAFTGYWPDSRL